MMRMKVLTRNALADQLGDEVSSLALRIGLHSGPITGGVLRGQKSRFQLFGDTINTASRMESLGVTGKIHVSEATATELRNHGCGSWLEMRQDKVTAKGKGEMTTYFVTPLNHSKSSMATRSVATSFDTSGVAASSELFRVSEKDDCSGEMLIAPTSSTSIDRSGPPSPPATMRLDGSISK